ncbi:hypothetical protein MHK_002422 [Candidatus Magnetomorum sp. HK-1]|nr:hypothetical protein MHK_002422 [Candidatus Magnetomorum sp. HK-1]
MKQFIITVMLIFAQTSLINSACLDIDKNTRVLKESIITLQALTAKDSTVVAPQSDISDINEDSKIGLAESIYLLQFIAGIQSSLTLHCATLFGTDIYAFNGIPVSDGWGEDLVYPVKSNTVDTRTMGPLGGIPLVVFLPRALPWAGMYRPFRALKTPPFLECAL